MPLTHCRVLIDAQNTAVKKEDGKTEFDLNEVQKTFVSIAQKRNPNFKISQVNNKLAINL